MYLSRAQNQVPKTEDKSQVALCMPWLALCRQLFLGFTYIPIASVWFAQSTKLTYGQHIVLQLSLRWKHSIL